MKNEWKKKRVEAKAWLRGNAGIPTRCCCCYYKATTTLLLVNVNDDSLGMTISHGCRWTGTASTFLIDKSSRFFSSQTRRKTRRPMTRKSGKLASPFASQIEYSPLNDPAVCHRSKVKNLKKKKGKLMESMKSKHFRRACRTTTFGLFDCKKKSPGYTNSQKVKFKPTNQPTESHRTCMFVSRGRRHLMTGDGCAWAAAVAAAATAHFA